MAVLIITHDLGVVANIADEVVVIYRGEIMEAGTVDAISSTRRAIPICRRCCAPSRIST